MYLMHLCAACWANSPPPEVGFIRLRHCFMTKSGKPDFVCGEGLGVGVSVGGRASHNNNDPPPQPSPTRGEGAVRARG